MCHRRAALSFSSLFQSLKDRFLFAPRLFFRKASAKLQPFFQPAKLYGNFFTFSSDFFARKGKKGKTGGRIGRFVMEKARPEGTKGRALGTWPSRPRLSSRARRPKTAENHTCNLFDRASPVGCAVGTTTTPAFTYRAPNIKENGGSTRNEHFRRLRKRWKYIHWLKGYSKKIATI